jgi:UDP-N-acetylmuramyl pentapeptide phosphotransferase/UDP-N-acetylglucosamine-1-phosphate transferase
MQTGPLNPVMFTVLAGACFAAGWLGVHAIESWLRARSVLDIPNDRSSHQAPVPRGGGVAIVAVVLLTIVAGTTARMIGPVQPLILLAFVAAMIAVVSFIDDLRTLSNRIRFAIHLAAAAVTMLAFGPWSDVAISSDVTLQLPLAAAIALSILWIVGLTNAYNFMDGIDLMAAGQAITAGLGWVVIGWMIHAPMLATLGGSIAASAAAFALHNRPPARIFMGDVGSAFLGYLLASLTVAAATIDPLAATCGALLVWPFVFDTAFTFLCRMRKREAIFRAHRSHLYQRLVIAGRSHLQVSMLYVALDLIGIACAVALLAHTPMAPAISIAALVLSAFGLWQFVRRTERARALQG